MRKSHDGRSGNGPADDDMDGLDSYAPGGAPRPAAASEPAADEQAAVQAESSDQGAAERELADQRDKFLRLAAEFDNFRKRTVRERAEAANRGQADLLEKCLTCWTTWIVSRPWTPQGRTRKPFSRVCAW